MGQWGGSGLLQKDRDWRVDQRDGKLIRGYESLLFTFWEHDVLERSTARWEGRPGFRIVLRLRNQPGITQTAEEDRVSDLIREKGLLSWWTICCTGPGSKYTQLLRFDLVSDVYSHWERGSGVSCRDQCLLCKG